MSERDNLQTKNEDKMDTLCHSISFVCADYAILAKYMCQHFNIQVDYVSGYTKLTTSCINDTADTNHQVMHGI